MIRLWSDGRTVDLRIGRLKVQGYLSSFEILSFEYLYPFILSYGTENIKVVVEIKRYSATSTFASRVLRLAAKERLPVVYIRMATLPFYVFFHLADLVCTSYIFSETKANYNFRSCKENLLV